MINYFNRSPLTPVPQFCKLRFVATNTSPAFWSPRPAGCCLQHEPPAAPSLRTSAAPLIYAVDDMRCLTELYSLVLKAAGYGVKTFNDRPAALASMKAETEKPDLLITDYRNTSLHVERFMHESTLIHPALRILMASGLTQTHIRLSHVRPHRFIQKPFTPQELLHEVKSTLSPK